MLYLWLALYKLVLSWIVILWGWTFIVIILAKLPVSYGMIWHRWHFLAQVNWSLNPSAHKAPSYYGRTRLTHPPLTKWHFTDNISKCIFMNENFCILIWISLRFVPKGLIDNNSALIQVMVWWQTVDKPLPDPVHWRRYAALGGDELTHWGPVMHICVSKLTTIGSDNGLSPGRRQAIIRTNAGIVLIGPLRTNSSEILIEIYIFSFKKMHLKLSSAKRRPFCLGLNVLILWLLMSWLFVLPGHQHSWYWLCRIFVFYRRGFEISVVSPHVKKW